MADSCTVSPAVARVCVAAPIVIDEGIGVFCPNRIGGTVARPLAGTTNGSDSPETVWPSMMHVTRALTGPKLAGTFGSLQDPSAFTRTLRFSTLTVHVSLS